MCRRGTPCAWRTLIEIVHPVRGRTAPPVTRTVHIRAAVLWRIRALTLSLELLVWMLIMTWWWEVVSRGTIVLVHVSIIVGRWVAAWHRVVISLATLVELVRGFVLGE